MPMNSKPYPITRCVLHNVGHHDLFVELYTANGADLSRRIGWCRPLSKFMESLGEALISHLKSYSATYRGYNSLRLNPPLTLSAGQCRFEYNERQREDFVSSETFEELTGTLEVRSVYAPLAHAILGTHEPSDPRDIIPRVEDKNDEIERLLFILITAGNDQRSPRKLAQVIQEIVERRWSERSDCGGYEVCCHHVDTDAHSVTPSQLLRLESRVVFEASRVAERYASEWRDAFKLYLSVSTGTTLMISAISLTFAEWSPKVQTISKARHLLQCTPTQPSMVYKPITQELSSIKEWVEVGEDQLNEASLLAVHEVRRWREDYLEQRQLRPEELKASNEEAVFFHRKGLKEVLCVVVICDRYGIEGVRNQRIPIRGINLEVSLPTGTLCAERNAIGTALGRFPQLERSDIEAVAVLSLDPHLSKLGPCGACQEWFRKVTEVSPSLRILSFGSPQADSIYVKPALLT